MKKNHLINEEIKNELIKLTGEITVERLISLKNALDLADEKKLDLVLLSDKKDFGVCKIMNYEKFIYDQMKKEKEKPKPLEMKEIKIGPNTSDNDLEYRIKHMKEFLVKGHRIKLSMQFRGREMVYVNKGEELILKLILAVEESGVAEMMPKLEGKRMFVIIRPIKK